MFAVAEARRPTIGIGTVILVMLNLGLAALVWAVAVADVGRVADALVPQAVEPPVARTRPVAVLPVNGSQAPVRPDRTTAAALEQTLARPLFTPDRRPFSLPPSKSEATVAPAIQSAPPPVPPKLRLVGVATLPDGARRVLMRRTGEVTGTWYAAGEQIDGWQLAVVGRAEIALTLGPERIVLGLAKPEPEDKSDRP